MLFSGMYVTTAHRGHHDALSQCVMMWPDTAWLSVMRSHVMHMIAYADGPRRAWWPPMCQALLVELQSDGWRELGHCCSC